MILYARSSPFRKPEYQSLTTIEKKGGKTRVFKKPLSTDGEPHAKQIVKNYRRLSRAGTPFTITEARHEEDGRISFDYIQGKGLDREFYEAVISDNLKKAHSILDGLIADIKQLPKHKVDPTQNKDYVSTFGRAFSGKQTCLELGYIDYNLDNLIRRGERLYLIDYEWLFNFPLPQDLVIGRMLYYSFISVTHYYQIAASPQKPVVAVGGIFTIHEDTYKKYRHHLENLAKIINTDEHLQNYVRKEQVQPRSPESIDISITRLEKSVFPSLVNRLEHAESRAKELDRALEHQSREIERMNEEHRRVSEAREELNKQLKEVHDSKLWRYGTKAKKIIRGDG